MKSKWYVVSSVLVLASGEVMDNLFDRLAQTAGTHKRDQIFQGIQLPSIGTPVAERPTIMKTVIDRMEKILDEDTFTWILSGCLRTLPDEWYEGARQKYLSCKNLDEYLDQRSHEYLAELEQIKDEGRLYFNQEITQEVIDFVRSQPEMRRGVRRGNVLYAVKIPYMAKEYLAEKNERMKRYYYCHPLSKSTPLATYLPLILSNYTELGQENYMKLQ